MQEQMLMLRRLLDQVMRLTLVSDCLPCQTLPCWHHAAPLQRDDLPLPFSWPVCCQQPHSYDLELPF